MNDWTRVKVIIDANVFISYLLAPTRKGAVSRVVDAAISGEIEVIVPSGLLHELQGSVGRRAHLRRNVAPSDAEALFGLLASSTRGIESSLRMPVVSRDPNDDYLLTAAIVNDVDYLITGDKDLLSVDPTLTPFMILRPAEFVAVVLDPVSDTATDNR